MKRLNQVLLGLGLMLAAVSCQPREAYLFTSFHEPSLDGMYYLYSLDGFQWDSLPGVWMKPQIGNDKEYYNMYMGGMTKGKFNPNPILRDPSITQGPDGTFHLVWTMAWDGERSFGYAHSTDLIHWSEQRAIPVMEDSVLTTTHVWAPEIFYEESEDLFYIAWSSTIPNEWRTEEDLKGSNACNRMYYTTTRDFQTFSPAQRYYDPGFNSIDGFLLKRAENDYVLIVKDNRKPGYSDCFCVFGSSPAGPFGNPTEKFTPHYSEGPCALRLGEEWIIYFDEYRGQQRFGAVTTRDFQTFTPVDDRISLPSNHKHGTIVPITQHQLRVLKRAAAKH